MSVIDDQPTDKIGLRRANRWLAMYMLVFTIVSCLLLIVNVGMVYSLYTGVAVFIPENYSLQIGQLVLLLGPFILLFVEWYLYDLIIQPFRRRS